MRPAEGVAHFRENELQPIGAVQAVIERHRIEAIPKVSEVREQEDAAIRQLDGKDRWFDLVKAPGAVFDSGLDVLVVPSFTIGQSILRGPLEATRISSDFADILQLR